MTKAQGKCRWAALVVAAISVTLAAAVAAPAQTYTTLVTFEGGDGFGPTYSALVQGTDGNLYGATSYGGKASCDPSNGGCGTVFKMTPAGTLTTIHKFCSQSNCADGAYPFGGLLLGTDGNFYGTTQDGGAYANANQCSSGCGTIFKITPEGTLTTIYNFCALTNCTDGSGPDAGLVQGTDGNLYGTTALGGASSSKYGYGTVFKITPAGVLTTLHSFDGTDGYLPFAALIQATDGNFYGTTFEGGDNNACDFQGYQTCGTIFKITPAGALTTLHSFQFTDGANPMAPLLEEADGSLAGTTSLGGFVAFEGCSQGCGTVFKLNSHGTLTTLHEFHFSDGGDSSAGLILGTDGKFYGAAGYIFTLFPYTDFFDDGTSTLLQATNGVFYGTTFGGYYGLYDGTVFSLDFGLGPFVTTLPTARRLGQKVTILGTNLTGSTSVTFNGKAATFTVNSTGTAINTTVPSGATTGPVQVVTPSGTLTSNVSFQVLP